MRRYILCVIVVGTIIPRSTNATVINIPDDYPTIQQGIDATTDGDTVLVSPGIYLENIYFLGHNITLGSRYLIGGDRKYIRQTIIDGGTAGSVVWFRHGEDSTAIITGFTIQNGTANNGGGVYINGSNPTIHQNIIKANHASTFYHSGLGGGIYCYQADPTISFNIIVDNITWMMGDADEGPGLGGGIYCLNSNPNIQNCVILNNVGQGAICCYDSEPIISNTIIWANFGNGIICEDSSPDITYSDIEGNQDGEGNIDLNPLFVNPLIGDYNICAQSPCLNAGDPNIFDPDESRSDIGLYFPEHPECYQGDIWHISVEGDDATGDGSLGNPFRTIQYGINHSLHSDTIMVHNGIYKENVEIYLKNIVLASNFIYTDDTLDIQNTAIDGGDTSSVISATGCDSITEITGFTITNGRALQDGGGGIRCIYSDLSIRNNIITGNRSSALEGGGGIYCMGSCQEIYSNYISDNLAEGNMYGGTGGGIKITDGRAVIKNNVICRNTAWSGAGINLKGIENLIINNAICDNSGYYGSGVCIEGDSNPAIINTIFWGNIEDDLYILYSDSSLIQYCNIQNMVWPGEGNISEDPLFRDPENGDYHLQSSSNPDCGDDFNSPCIDTGFPRIADRQLDCAWGLGDARSDMGAYGGSEIGGIIIYVPDDYATIQAAINASVHGDTILVLPQTYHENISFRGKAVLVASLFLTTDDSSYIASTIIDGDSTDTVVKFENGESNASAIMGFTIQNGFATDGAGVLCDGTSPKISYNIIKNNISANISHGGGIYCRDYSNAIINNNVIMENTAMWGGGIYSEYSDPDIEFNAIVSNSAISGGGICCWQSSITSIGNNTITDNMASGEGGGLLCYRAYPTVINNIFWGDNAGDGDEIRLNYCSFPISFCDIEDTIWPGEGNISADPLFCDADNRYFWLAENSPCLEAGQDGENIGAFGIGCEATEIFEAVSILPVRFAIRQNYPNPFNAATTIKYELPYQSRVTIVIYDILGRKVGTLVDGLQPAGYHQVIWNAKDLSSGVYFYKLQTGIYNEAKKMMLIK